MATQELRRGGQRTVVFAVVVVVLVAVQTGYCQRPPDVRYEGDACMLPNGAAGTCRLLTSCPSQQSLMQANQSHRPQICSFQGKTTVVCCGVRGGSPTITHLRPGDRIVPVPQGNSGPAPRGPVPASRVPGPSRGFVDPARRLPAPTSGPAPRVPGSSPRGNTPSPRKSSFERLTDGNSVATNQVGPGAKSRRACTEYSVLSSNVVNPLINSGTPTIQGEYPHMALLGYMAQGQTEISWNCGGALISDRYVVTAAHCFTERSLRAPVRVRLGEYDLEDDVDEAKDYTIESHVIHPQYTKQSWYNDLALIRLSEDVVFTSVLKPVCIWSRPEDPKTGLEVIGWGSTSEEGGEGTKSTVLLKGTGTLSRVAPEVCAQSYRAATRQLRTGIHEGQICAMDSKGTVDTCRGDSGGPIQVVRREPGIGHYIVGVTSGGVSLCGSRVPSIYTRLYHYLGWIEGIVWKDSFN